MKTTRVNHGFTLMELLVVLAIFTTLAVVMIPVIAGAMRTARVQRAKADVAKIGAAIKLLQYDTGKLPGGCPVGPFMCNPEFAISDVELNQGALPTPPPGTSYLALVNPPALYSDHTAGALRCASGDYCEWLAEDVAKWRGPYFSALPTRDPWGGYYWLDNDYAGYSGNGVSAPGCGSVWIPDRCGNDCANMHDGVAIISRGPDKVWYTCDDLAYYLSIVAN